MGGRDDRVVMQVHAEVETVLVSENEAFVVPAEENVIYVLEEERVVSVES